MGTPPSLFGRLPQMTEPFRDHLDVLAEFRRGLRGFLRYSEETAGRYGTTPAVYQLLLVLATARRPADITVAANALSLRHQAAAELVQKAEAAGFLTRSADEDDARRSMLSLTAQGREAVLAIAWQNAKYLQSVRGEAFDILRELDRLLT